ncbi:hypothetical protein [Lawsonibacter celer]|uniref:hypothetical protein n=1 Tax=Lawsonibacter celer TaxID=2986526 RepID=UPI001FADB4C3|nr:hypothetical protein [Lawsonibacter celer]
MSTAIGLTHPEQLDIAGPDGMVTRGADQEWYPTLWQRRAGCGPTCAALIFAYLAAAHPEKRALYREGAMDRASFIALMCRVWEHVTPRSHGLNRPEWMVEGMRSYAAQQGLALSPALLEIPSARTKRPDYETVSAFLTAALRADCPVAFLNLHQGKVKELDWWHWVTIIALDGRRATLLDSGKELEIDLALWLETTRRRGGFVAALTGAEG